MCTNSSRTESTVQLVHAVCTGHCPSVLVILCTRGSVYLFACPVNSFIAAFGQATYIYIYIYIYIFKFVCVCVCQPPDL